MPIPWGCSISCQGSQLAGASTDLLNSDVGKGYTVGAGDTSGNQAFIHEQLGSLILSGRIVHIASTRSRTHTSTPHPTHTRRYHSELETLHESPNKPRGECSQNRLTSSKRWKWKRRNCLMIGTEGWGLCSKSSDAWPTKASDSVWSILSMPACSGAGMSFRTCACYISIFVIYVRLVRAGGVYRLS